MVRSVAARGGIARRAVRWQLAWAAYDGLTVLELVVAVALCATLLALLLPAVQSARAAARRLQCQQNLKQLALAMHDYHTTCQSFPYGVNGGWGQSWSAHLLPFVEQSALARTIPWSDRGWWRGTDRNSRALQRLAQTRLPLFRCPAQGAPSTSSVNQLPERYVTNYLACAGGDARHDNHGPGGMSVSNGVIVAADFIGLTRPPHRLQHIRDGTSNTLLLGEAVFLLDESAGCATCDRFYLYHPNADRQHGIDFSEALGSTFYPMNTQSHREIERECAFSSAHAGGVIGALADGSTRFFDQSLSLEVWRLLGSIRDQQAVPAR
jgi:type II secretory pathway pseudopilin PulG